MYEKISKKDLNRSVSWTAGSGKEQLIMDNMLMLRENDMFRRLQCLSERIQMIQNCLIEKTEVLKRESQYRIFGKYKVRETYAGEDSLTALLAEYVERSVSMNYQDRS